LNLTNSYGVAPIGTVSASTPTPGTVLMLNGGTNRVWSSALTNVSLVNVPSATVTNLTAVTNFVLGANINLAGGGFNITNGSANLIATIGAAGYVTGVGSRGYYAGASGEADVGWRRGGSRLIEFISGADGTRIGIVVSNVIANTVAATNGFVVPGISNAPTIAQIGRTNTIFIWASNDVPPTVRGSYYNSASNLVDKWTH
jgi:hypothetical protein